MKKVGYSRMVKVGNRVLIGGTTSVQPGVLFMEKTVLMNRQDTSLKNKSIYWRAPAQKIEVN